jgi:hypothetical protein
VTGGSTIPDDEQWNTTTRKRKRAKDKEGIKGLKLRKSSSAGDSTTQLKDGSEIGPAANNESKKLDTQNLERSKAQCKDDESNPAKESPIASTISHKSVAGLGLGDYSSDEEG